MLRVMIGTTHYNGTPTNNVIQRLKLKSNIENAIETSQKKFQGVSPGGLQMNNFEKEKFQEIEKMANTEEELNDSSNSNLKKANEEQNFYSQMLSGKGWFSQISTLQDILNNPEEEIRLLEIHTTKYTGNEPKLDIDETAKLVEIETLEKKDILERNVDDLIKPIEKIRKKYDVHSVNKISNAAMELTKNHFKRTKKNYDISTLKISELLGGKEQRELRVKTNLNDLD